MVDLPRWGLATVDDHSDIFLLHCARSCDISFSRMYSQPVHSSMSCIHCLLGLPWRRNPSMIPSRTVSANRPLYINITLLLSLWILQCLMKLSGVMYKVPVFNTRKEYTFSLMLLIYCLVSDLFYRLLFEIFSFSELCLYFSERPFSVKVSQ